LKERANIYIGEGERRKKKKNQKHAGQGVWRAAAGRERKKNQSMQGSDGPKLTFIFGVPS
jgi:hypothetical protein